jgi:ABC-type molybdate transport system substrate-binding protein
MYRVRVVSEIAASLTVITENEATYLAEGFRKLAGVSVHVVSRSSGRTASGITGDNGTIVFANLTEDLYEVVAQKLEHKSYRQEILLVNPGMTILAFLQTEAVSYTFSVVPVPILDKYVVEVKTSFRTNGTFVCYSNRK